MPPAGVMYGARAESSAAVESRRSRGPLASADRGQDHAKASLVAASTPSGGRGAASPGFPTNWPGVRQSVPGVVLGSTPAAGDTAIRQPSARDVAPNSSSGKRVRPSSPVEEARNPSSMPGLPALN